MKNIFITTTIYVVVLLTISLVFIQNNNYIKESQEDDGWHANIIKDFKEECLV